MGLVDRLLLWVLFRRNWTLFKLPENRKKTKSKELATEFSINFIESQLILGSFNDRYKNSQEVVRDLFLLGYVYGVGDCTTQMMCVEEEDTVGCMTVICVKLKKKQVFPFRSGTVS